MNHPLLTTKANASASMQESASARASADTDDFISKLERLAKLKEQGILTEEEFQAQKMKILNP